jgi:hypothetical protein
MIIFSEPEPGIPINPMPLKPKVTLASARLGEKVIAPLNPLATAVVTVTVPELPGAMTTELADVVSVKSGPLASSPWCKYLNSGDPGNEAGKC